MEQRHYKLDSEHNLVPCAITDPEFLSMFDGNEEAIQRRIVNKTDLGEVHISTVFLGFDHNFYDGGEPILFETMIFGGEHDQYQRRYRTWADAAEGHTITCLWLMGYGPEPE